MNLTYQTSFSKRMRNISHRKNQNPNFIQLYQFANHKSNELFSFARALNFLQLPLFDSYCNQFIDKYWKSNAIS